MTQHLPLWYLDKIDPAKCDQMLAEYDEQKAQKAAMGIDGQSMDAKHRNTDVVFAPFDHWFSSEMEQFAFEANQQTKWDYEINQREAIQFAQYGIDQHYGWHVDNFPLAGKSVDRKVTVVCLLNDPSEFEGGELQLRLYQEYTAPLKKGTLIAFPSIIEHRVLPVTKGVRYSAALWTAGPRFR